ncbi:cell division protein FtsA [Anaerorhabdus sp.]|jgi:cell division protein FtsA|uniref:cell division protein FtsA n=1 Tax=Anaerorhabdus sp. TaxID=1872524 RepID=UPI002FCC18AD
MDKQIFAALEIADHEIRLIIGEFFNTRFNIIKVERVPAFGIENNRITDIVAIQDSIKKAVDNAARTVGAKIERVLLCIPSVNMHRYPLKVNTKVESIEQVVTIQDIRRSVKKAMATKIDDSLAMVQAVCTKYTCNGISTRRMPVNERCNDLTIDIDLLCVDKDVAFDLVRCVEEIGLNVMDIYLDSYAIAKEAALFEQTMDQNVIVIKLERQSTTLGLLAKGKLVSSEIFNKGIESWIKSIKEKFDLPEDTISRLLKYNARLDETKYSDSPIYIWANHGETFTMSEKELCDCVNNDVQKWLEDMKAICLPILNSNKTTVMITGEGGELQGLASLLAKQLNAEVKNYTPETLGVRYSGLSTCLGLFFAYKDQLPINGQNENSVDMEQFIKTVQYKEKNPDSEEESITKRLKGMLFEARK